jgi:hypothetical protein
MARIRSINPIAPTDEDVATMSIAARLVWAYLPCHADKEGRLKDSAFMLKLAILPADNIDMEAILNELADRRHIIRYQAGSGKFIQIRNFKKYQNPHKNEIASSIPPPPETETVPLAKLPEQLRLAPEQDRTAPAVRSGSDPSPDPGPGPDPILVSVTRARWTAYQWLTQFKIAWEARHPGNFYGTGTSDPKACGDLTDVIAALPEPEAFAAQDRAPAMFAEFLGEESPAVIKARHPFAFFVQRWNSLRIPADPRAIGPPGKPKDVRVGYVPAPGPETTYPKGVQEL